MTNPSTHNRAAETLAATGNSLRYLSETCGIIAGVAGDVRHIDPVKSAAAFSDLYNALITERGDLKNLINRIKRALAAQPADDALAEDLTLATLDHRASLKAIHDYMGDFIDLMDCTTESSTNNPDIYAGYLSKRINRFAADIREQAAWFNRNFDPNKQ